METAYGHTTESSSRSGPPAIQAHAEYAKSVPGMLKLAEVFLSILILICASVNYWVHLGGGWVQFVSATAMIISAVFFFFHFFNILLRLPGPWVTIEFGYYLVYSVFFCIAAIVAAVRANLTAAIGAACFFTFVCLAVFIVDTYFMYRSWQTFQQSKTTETDNVTTAQTTTTTTTYETRTQY